MLVEPTCLLDSFQCLESARGWKQFKEEYFQILFELDCLGVTSQYDAVKVSVLGHYLPSLLSELFWIVTMLQSVLKAQCQKLGLCNRDIYLLKGFFFSRAVLTGLTIFCLSFLYCRIMGEGHIYLPFLQLHVTCYNTLNTKHKYHLGNNYIETVVVVGLRNNGHN